MRRNEDQVWRAQLAPLNSGVYRIIIEGPELTHPIADVFAVLA